MAKVLPIVGNFVHFVEQTTGRHLPLLVVVVHNDDSLAGWVFGEGSLFYVPWIQRSESWIAGTWHPLEEL